MKKIRMNNQSLFKVGHKLFKKDHPMNHKRGIIMLYAPCDILLDIASNEEEELALATEVVKYLTIDYHFSNNTFLQYIVREFEQSFKRITAQNTINKYVLFNFIRFIILQEGMASPEANKARKYVDDLQKDDFVYKKLNLSEHELNTKLSTALRRITKQAFEISGLKV